MGTIENIKKSSIKLYKWLVNNNFKGYDPYDALNTNINLFKKYKLTRLFITYLLKFFPINIRSILGIKRTKDKQAIGLIIKSKLLHPNLNNNSEASHLIDYIISRSLYDEYSYHCWNGHNYWIQTLREYQSPRMPGIVGTATCADAIFEYYKLNASNKLKDIIISVRDFFLNILYYENDDNAFFRYKPHSPKTEWIYNASLIAALYILRINNYLDLKDGNDKAHKAVESVLNKQKKSGAWNYGIDLKTGEEKKQIDFHQGFILDSIHEYLEYFPNKNVEKKYRKGLEYYKNNQFDEVGQSYYRYPRKYPIDIHNQSQGIITFSKAKSQDNRYLNIAKNIAEWTIKNMQDDQGYFYYMKYPLFTNKVPYIRWSQAWMFYAFSIYLKNKNS